MISELVKFNEQLQNGELSVQPGQDEVYSDAASETDCGRQGDLYFRHISQVPENYKEVAPFKKMVPGTTKGSQHCFAEMPHKCFVPQNWSETYDELSGPIVLINKNVLLHPEHGNVTFDASCGRLVEFGYQRDQDQEERIQRRQD